MHLTILAGHSWKRNISTGRAEKKQGMSLWIGVGLRIKPTVS